MSLLLVGCSPEPVDPDTADTVGHSAEDSVDTGDSAEIDDSSDTGDTGDALTPTVAYLGDHNYDANQMWVEVGPFGSEPTTVIVSSPDRSRNEEKRDPPPDSLSTIRVLGPPWTGGPLDSAAFASIVAVEDEVTVSYPVAFGDADGDGLGDLALLYSNADVAGHAYITDVVGEFDPADALSQASESTGQFLSDTGTFIDSGPGLLGKGTNNLDLHVYEPPLLGHIEPTSTLEIGSSPPRPVFADTDGDGRDEILVLPDVVATLAPGTTIDIASAASGSIAPTGEIMGRAAGDVNGDGYADALAVVQDGVGSDVWYLEGFLGPLDHGAVAPSFEVHLDGLMTLPAVADVDADGWNELVVPSPGSDTDATLPGRLFVFAGPISSGSYGEDDATLEAAVSHTADFFGAQLFPVELDGLPGTDLVASAPDTDGAAYQGGTVHLLFAPDLVAP